MKAAVASAEATTQELLAQVRQLLLLLLLQLPPPPPLLLLLLLLQLAPLLWCAWQAGACICVLAPSCLRAHPVPSAACMLGVLAYAKLARLLSLRGAAQCLRGPLSGVCSVCGCSCAERQAA